MTNPLTQERVRELFDLDYETGVLRWRVNRRRARMGDIAGNSTGRGYYKVMIDYKMYYLHRVIFLYAFGYLPEHHVDHISQDKSDNRPCNLREVAPQCNIRNTGLRSDNKSGVKGVSWNKCGRKWRTQIVVGKERNLGLHGDFTEAVAHRLAAEECLDWAGCDSNSSAFLYMQNYLKDIKCR